MRDFSVKTQSGVRDWKEAVSCGIWWKQTTSSWNVHVLFLLNDCLEREKKKTLKHIRHYYQLDAILFFYVLFKRSVEVQIFFYLNKGAGLMIFFFKGCIGVQMNSNLTVIDLLTGAQKRRIRITLNISA